MYYFLDRPSEIREIQRPRNLFSISSMWLIFIVSLGIQSGALIILLISDFSIKSFIGYCLAGCIFWSLVFAKELSKLLIRHYQYFAPMDVRLRCMMMPSCSDYGLMSITRYGAMKGALKTWKRLHTRCYGYYCVDFP